MGPKKKLSKMEKAKLEAEHAETMRIEMEKERQRKHEEEKQRKMIERAEAERRHKQEIEDNKIRRVQLKESCEYFNEIKEEIKCIYADFQKQKQWQRYMRCNGLPNAYDPGDLRKYIHMWCLNTDTFNLEERNWLLQTNERTVLTQNQIIPNLTKIHLKTQQRNLGDAYVKRIKEILGILDEIEEASMDDENISATILIDLQKLKFKFRILLSQHIDEFTYKIVSNINRDMILDGPVIAKYLYKSDVFKCQLWTLRDIPQPQLNPKEKLRAEKHHTEIDFPVLEINVALPPAIKLKNSAIRALWLNYDHFSDCCPSFVIPYQKKIVDISVAARKEWRKRKEILKSTLEDPVKVNPAVPFDALDIQESNVIDVDKLYEQYEIELNNEERWKKGPEGLKLKEFEINLRSHQIVGGVYCLEYLEQPTQDTKLCTKTKTFLRNVIYPNILKRNHFHHPYRAPDPVPAGVRRLPEEIEAEMKLMEKNLDKMASITIKLPDNVMWFEPPTVCRWETVEETKISEQNKKSLSKRADMKSSNLKSTSRLQAKTIQDFNLHNIPSDMDVNCLMQEFVIPRLPNGYEIKINDIDITRKNSILKYLNKDNNTSVDNRKSPKYAFKIKEILEETNSPRPLFPKVTMKRCLEVVEQKISCPCDLELNPSIKDENLTYNVYMFSRLLNDLDELSELQSPYFEKQIEEISASLSLSNLVDEREDENDIDLEHSGVNFFKSSDADWGQTKHDVSQEMFQQIEKESSICSSDSDLDAADGYADISDESQEKQHKITSDIGKWSTRDVHDVKFNEDKLAIQFKVGRLGTYGLAVNWYSNLPYQTWELKPDFKTTQSVIYSLTAAVVSIEVSINENGIMLNAFQGGTSSIIQDSIGTSMSFVEFKKMFTTAGINLFPENDAFCYAEGTCEKNSVMENHLYTCMANLTLTYNFSWSRWNLLSGSRTTVLLMREIIEHRKIPNYLTLLVTPLNACIIDCSEVSSSFNSNGIPGMDFYADLHHLSQAHSQNSSKEKQNKMNPLTRENVLQILKSTRPLSFC